MHFPIAGIECHPIIPPLVAFIVSFFGSMGGISGAFLLLPFQMSFLGYTHPSVSATNQLYNTVAIPSGVWRFIKEGRMLWPLTVVIIVGTLPGVFIGAIIRATWLPDATNFKLFAACVLLYIGGRMLRDLMHPSLKQHKAMSTMDIKTEAHQGMHTAQTNIHNIQWNMQRVQYTFQGEEFSFPVRGIFSITLLVGIIGGIYGIGGGAFLSPLFMSFFGLPIYTVAGASLMGTLITSIAGVIFYISIAPWYPHLSMQPDWFLGILFGLGGAAGMYIGARCQRYVPAKYIKYILITVLLGTAGQYIIQFLAE